VGWIDPGEFQRGAAAREEARVDRERVVLDEILASGWSRTTATEARRLQDAVGDAVARSLTRVSPPACDETALGLVGEARGIAVADWWANHQGLDDRTRRLLRDVAASAAAMAMLDGFTLGQECAKEDTPRAAVPAPVLAPTFTRTNGARPALATAR
jgi:hypothetical protein